MQEDNNYYVYIHKNKVTGDIFYVGSGRLKRAEVSSGRSKEWRKIAKTFGFDVEIVYDNLDKKTSLEKERSVYLQYKDLPSLVNKRIPGILKQSSVEYLKSKFYYDESSPTCLRHNMDVTRGRKNANIAARKGDVAGCNTDTTRSISVNRFVYPIHRVIWMLHNGEIPDGYVIDHIDGDVRNNLISNLRATTCKTNTQNRAKPVTNTSGAVGVNLLYYKGVPRRWCAAYAKEGKRFMKYFVIEHNSSSEEAFRLAVEWRTEQIRLLNEQGAGYTERHGT